jgi:hypothetical protein
LISRALLKDAVPRHGTKARLVDERAQVVVVRCAQRRIELECPLHGELEGAPRVEASRARIRVRGSRSLRSCLVDHRPFELQERELVAQEPVPPPARGCRSSREPRFGRVPPRGSLSVGGATFLVDTPHQILVNKLCALLNRSELRDIEDIKALLDGGGDLPRALEDCPRQNGGFSPMTLSWSLRSLPIERLAASLCWATERIDALARFRDGLLDRVLERVRPDR